MTEMLNAGRVMICVGSGGVGKTTVAAALGFLAAKEGRRVLVLTIDPSQRLKTTLGLKSNGEISEIHHPDINGKGKLSAAVVDAKKVFDDFIRRATTKPDVVNRILKNKLYIQLSTTLSGSQEFTALEKMYSCYESGEYDLIILDTPPTKHAIDFLQAPQKLSALFNEKIAKWFREPEKKGLLSTIVQSSTRQILKALELLTGTEFIRELADFFSNIEAWRSKLDERVSAAHRLLTSEETHFCLVTSYDRSKLKEAEYFGREIFKGGYHLSAVIINRAYPLWFESRITVSKPDSEGSALVDQYQKMKRYYLDRELVYKNFAERFGQQMKEDLIFKIPAFDHDLCNLSDVADLAKVMLREDQA